MTNVVRLLGLENPLEPLRREAEAGDPESQFLMGEVYFHGGYYSLPCDYEEAVKWYKKAADRNHAESQAKLGEFYETGYYGLEKNLIKAEEWYRRAEENGHRESIVRISYLHDNFFHGTKRLPPFPPHELYALNKKGAELKLSHCQSNLAELYFEGKGVSKNLVYAYAWCKIAFEHEEEVRWYHWNELNAQISFEEKAQAHQVVGHLRELISKQQKEHSSFAQRNKSKPWLDKLLRHKKTEECTPSKAQLIREAANRAENKKQIILTILLMGASGLFSVFVCYLVNSLILAPRNVSEDAATCLLVASFLASCLASGLLANIAFWRLYEKPSLVAEYLEIFRRVGMPPRRYRQDTASSYIGRLIDGSTVGPNDELTEKAYRTVREIAEEMKWRQRLKGTLHADRYWSVIDEVLEVVSPVEEAPPFTSGPIHQWVNEATFEDLSKIGHVSEDMCQKIIAERPFSNNRQFYTFLKKQNLEPLTATYFYMSVDSVSEKWEKEKQES